MADDTKKIVTITNSNISTDLCRVATLPGGSNDTFCLKEKLENDFSFQLYRQNIWKLLKPGESITIIAHDSNEVQYYQSMTIVNKINVTTSDPTPEASTDSKLSALSVTISGSGTQSLVPTFSSDTLSYTCTLPKGTTKFTINATSNDPKATVSGDGEITSSIEGAHNVICTAEDGTTKTVYVINCTIQKE